MNPTIFSDTPAKDDMGMDYIPVYADGDGNDNGSGPGFSIAPVVNNLGCVSPRSSAAIWRGGSRPWVMSTRRAFLESCPFARQRLGGSLKVRTWANGCARAISLMRVYAPDLSNARESICNRCGGISLLKVSARDRLLALGVSENQIQRLERKGVFAS